MLNIRCKLPITQALFRSKGVNLEEGKRPEICPNTISYQKLGMLMWLTDWLCAVKESFTCVKKKEKKKRRRRMLMWAKSDELRASPPVANLHPAQDLCVVPGYLG